MANLNYAFYQLTLQYFTEYHYNHLIQCGFTNHSSHKQERSQPGIKGGVLLSVSSREVFGNRHKI